jgi:hypothetical protein
MGVTLFHSVQTPAWCVSRGTYKVTLANRLASDTLYRISTRAGQALAKSAMI